MKTIGRTRLRNVALEVVMVALALLFIYPLVLVVMNSFKSYGEIYNSPISFPQTLRFENYVFVWNDMNYLLKVLKARGPRSLKVVTLLSKPSRRLVETPVDYVGFTIEDLFVVGYGLDYNERFRNLKDIVVYGS